MPSQAAFSTGVPLPLKYKDKIESGIKAEALKWGVALPENIDLSSYEFYGQKQLTPRLRNRPIEMNTSYMYEQQYRQFWKYCAIRGKYQPMLMLLSPAPLNVPSMDLSVVEEFPRFKRLPPGTPLMSIDGSTQVKDILGTPMTSEGSWNAPKICEHFQAAIGNIHEANGRAGQYCDPCDACRALPLEEKHKGCQHHLGEPRLFAKGNPVEHQDFKNTAESLKKKANEAGYKEHGSSQLLPSDIRILNNNLLSSGTIVGLQTWVIVISAIKQAWRHDDFYDMCLEKFLPQHFQIRRDLLSALALQVFGKADKQWIPQKLHADNEYPELCPCRPLLIYMHIIGIKGGYLFPSESELFDPPADGIYKTTINYQTFLESFKELCHRILPPRKDLKIGCQTFRKSFYVVAVFGGGEESDVRMSARHASPRNSEKYRQDAMTCYVTHKEHPNPSNNVSSWKPIHIAGSGGNSALMTAYSGFEYVDPSFVGTYYVRTVLGIPETNPLEKNIPFLIQAAMRHGIDNVDPDEELNEWVSNNVHPSKVQELQSLIGGCVQKQVRTIVNCSDQNMLLARSVAVLPAPPAGFVLQEQTSKRQKVASEKNDLHERHEPSTLQPREKIQVMLKLWDSRESWPKPLTPGAKTFNIKHLTPVMRCLENHFHRNVDLFLTEYPHYKHTTFTKEYCGGIGSGCCPKN
jgi:hypothetical protein